MPTWVIQSVEALSINDGRDLDKGNEPLFVDHFSNGNYFSAALHEFGTSGVAQDDDDQNDYDDSNTYENSEEPPGIDLDTESARGKIGEVPTTDHPVEIPWVEPL